MIKRAAVIVALASPFTFAALSPGAAQGFVAGVRVGPNVSWNQSNHYGALLGATAGAFATFDLGPVVSIQAEVNYSEKGWGDIFGSRTRFGFLEIPILARITPTDRWPLQPFAVAGVAHGREVSCNTRRGMMIIDDALAPFANGVFPYHSEIVGCDEVYDTRAKHDVGFVLGLGVLRHTKQFQYSFEYRRTRGQRDLLNPSASRYFREPTNDVSALVFGAAYRIR